jgi:hypothetical protein
MSELMIDYNLGVTLVETYEIKRFIVTILTKNNKFYIHHNILADKYL